MSDDVVRVGLWIVLAGTAVLTICIPVFKRPDVSWFDFLVAGPFVALKPAKYFGERYKIIAPTMIGGLFLLWIIVWIASWIQDN